MYLATTRLREFWPDYKPIVMLGEWCIPEGELFTFKPDSDYSILPYPWDDRERFGKAAEYVQNVYERLLVQFAEALNDIHGLDKSVTHWRIIIGPWLSWYLEAFYDRYVCLLEALQEDSEIITIGLDSNSYVTPDDFGHFVNLYVDDEYNLMLYTQILEALEINMIRKSLPDDWQHNVGRTVRGKSLKNVVQSYCFETFNRIRENMVRRSEIALVSSGIPFTAGLKLCIYSGFKIACCNKFRQVALTDLDINNKMRNQLKSAIKPCDDFEYIVKSTISWNIPKAYVEDFGRIRHFTLNRFESIPKVILSANGWYSDESFKIFAADACDADSKLISIQHGGYYGMLKYMSPEVHEQMISEQFYSWGWGEGLVPETHVKVMPSLKFVNFKNIKFKRRKFHKKESIILVTTKHPRYLYRFQSHPVGPQWIKYFELEFRFVNDLADDAKKSLKIRQYPHTYGWNIKNLWCDMESSTIFDDKKNMVDNYISASILIIDHPSTTFLEAFVSDVPSVLFWNPTQFLLRQNVQPYFDRLRKVGILHDTPESAAIKVNEIYEDPESWWQRPEIQNAKNDFCQQFAYSSENWANMWEIELINQINKPY